MLHLNPIQIRQIEEILHYLDSSFYIAVKDNPLHQQSDGNVEIVISLGNTVERAKNTSKVETSIVVYSSMMHKEHTRGYYASLEEALDAVRDWYFSLSSDGVRVSEERPQLRVIK